MQQSGSQTKLPSGSKCWECATVHSRAFGGYSWEELLLKIRTSQHLQSVFKEAKLVLAGKAQRTFVPESLDDWQAFDVIMERTVLAYSIEEFKAEFGCLPDSIGMETHDWHDERGEMMKLVFLQDPSEPHRRVRIQNKAGLLLQKQISGAEGQLRPRQNADLLKAIMAKRLKHDPLAKPKSAAEVHALAHEGREKEKKEAENVEKQRLATEAPPLQTKAENAQQDEPFDHEGEAVVVDNVAATVFSHYAEEQAVAEFTKSGKGKGKERPWQRQKQRKKSNRRGRATLHHNLEP